MAYKNKLTTHISANATQFNSELNKASTKMKNFGRNMAQSSKGASGSFNKMSGSSKGFTSA